MEGQWVSWDSERNSLENGNWRQLAQGKILTKSTKGSTEHRNHSLVQSIRLYEFFSSSVQSGGMCRESHVWNYARP